MNLGDIYSNGYIYNSDDLDEENITLRNTSNATTATTNDYTTLNKPAFIRSTIDEHDKVVRNDLCFIKDNTMYCLKGTEDPCTYSNIRSQYLLANIDVLSDAFGPNAFESGGACTSGLVPNLQSGEFAEEQGFWCEDSNMVVTGYDTMRYEHDDLSCGVEFNGSVWCGD